MPTTDRDCFIKALRRHGYQLRNTQDGAHELYHALTSGTFLDGRDRGQREKLNKRIEEVFPGIDRWWNEVEARVVERMVCARLGTENELLPFDKALRLSIEEAEYFSVPVATFEKTVQFATVFGTTKRARTAVDLMIAYALNEERG
jgi:hypothetical protein